jgi:hypothetical protein
MSEISDLFTELLYGSGAWIGAILISAIILLVTSRVKYSGAVFMPITIFMGMQYLNTVSTNNNLMWMGILMFIMSIYSLGMLIKDVKG